MKLSIDAARAHATVGEISAALEEVFGRHTAAIRTITGVYRNEVGEAPNVTKVRTMVDEFAEAQGRRPRILVAKMGQDGHDRGQKVIATAFADLGFDVDVGPLFQTPEEVARQAVEADVHVVGVSTLAAGHLTLVPAAQAGARASSTATTCSIVVGGVIPPQDFDALREAGATAIFPSGTVIADAALELLDELRRRSLTTMVDGPPIDLDAYEAGVLAADRTTLGRAITLVESTRPDHQEAAQELLIRLLPKAGGAHRIGITGVPGAGKSTFVDALGSNLTASGNRVAVLAVDPSSSRTGGSILGDKTRMSRLSVDERAFIRPSPSSGVLGGVARATRETIVVVEAAGFDVVFVETVGVGQSEITVANMVDTFLLLTLARSGDSLQGIKKGVLELADVIAVNKADGEYVRTAKGAAQELAGALHLMAPRDDGWVTPVLTCSALEGIDLDTVWDQLRAHRRPPRAHRPARRAAATSGRAVDVGGDRRPPAGPLPRPRSRTAWRPSRGAGAGRRDHADRRRRASCSRTADHRRVWCGWARAKHSDATKHSDAVRRCRRRGGGRRDWCSARRAAARRRTRCGGPGTGGRSSAPVGRRCRW